MKYICLRNCYVGERLWKAGKTYDLPDNMEKNEKNFSPIGEAPETLPATPQATPEAVEDKVTTIPPTDNLICPDCGKECKSEFGLKSHLRVHKKK